MYAYRTTGTWHPSDQQKVKLTCCCQCTAAAEECLQQPLQPRVSLGRGQVRSVVKDGLQTAAKAAAAAAKAAAAVGRTASHKGCGINQCLAPMAGGVGSIFEHGLQAIAAAAAAKTRNHVLHHSAIPAVSST
jgi:hypothetical protein